jgi:hypothetical protein
MENVANDREKIVLVPYGKPHWNSYSVGLTIKADVQPADRVGVLKDDESPAYMKFEFDQFNQLSSSSILGRIYLAYLNIACTSLLPNESTGLTGMHIGISFLRMCWTMQPYSGPEVALLRDCLQFNHSHLPYNITKDLVIRYLLISHTGELSTDFLFRRADNAATKDLIASAEIIRQVRRNNRDASLMHPVDRLTLEERNALIGTDHHQVIKNLMGGVVSLSYSIITPDVETRAWRRRKQNIFHSDLYAYARLNKWRASMPEFINSDLKLQDINLYRLSDRDEADIGSMTLDTFCKTWPMVFDLIAQSNDDYSDDITRLQFSLLENEEESSRGKAAGILLDMLLLLDKHKNDALFEEAKHFINSKISKKATFSAWASVASVANYQEAYMKLCSLYYKRPPPVKRSIYVSWLFSLSYLYIH